MVGVVAIMLALVSMTQGLTQIRVRTRQERHQRSDHPAPGTLKGQLSEHGATTFDVCQLLANPVADDIILIDAEQMEIVSVATLPGNGSTKLGGCRSAIRPTSPST